MALVQHPHIAPPLVITVDDDTLDAHVAAGWLPLVEEEPYTPDPEPTGEGDSPKENK